MRILGLSARVMPRKQQVGLAVVVATVLVLAHGACAQDEGVLSGCYSQPTARAGIQTVNCDAADTVSGHTIGYTLSVPAACVSGSCGVVLDIHGYTMSASAEEQQDEMRHKASARGMIVVQPSAPRGPHRQDTRESAPSWQPLYHHHQIILFLRHIVDLFQVDRRAVHVTGYSQGGFATWNILCLAPDLICSAAPLAASGLDQWGPGYGNQCFNDNGPSIPRAVLYTTGETDTSAPYSNAQRQVANLQRIYGWHDTSPTVVQGREYTQSTWTTDDMTFTFIDHNYHIYNWMGHCFPTIGRRCCAGIDRCFRCCEAEFTWSDVVLDFFASNPCDGGGQGSGDVGSGMQEGDSTTRNLNDPCIGDVNRDGRVNVADLLLVLGAYGSSSCAASAPLSSATADMNADCSVDVADLLLCLSVFGQVCPDTAAGG